MDRARSADGPLESAGKSRVAVNSRRGLELPNLGSEVSFLVQKILMLLPVLRPRLPEVVMRLSQFALDWRRYRITIARTVASNNRQGLEFQPLAEAHSKPLRRQRHIFGIQLNSNETVS